VAASPMSARGGSVTTTVLIRTSQISVVFRFRA
jgi:hypothetical protein